MRIRFFFFLLLQSIILTATAQQLLPVDEKAYADSLTHQLTQVRTDSARANINFLLSDYWRSKDTLKSRTYLDRGHAQSAQTPYLAALYHFYEGQYLAARNSPLAADAFKTAIDQLAAFHSPASQISLAASWYNYGIAVRAEKGDDFLIDILLNKAIPLAEQAGNPEKTAHYYSQLATVLMYNAQFDKAETYNQKAIGLLEHQMPESTVLMLAYLSAASNYIYKGQSEIAKKMLDKAQIILAPHPESTHYPNFYYNEGLYYTSKGLFNLALESLNKGIEKAEAYGQTTLLQMLVFRKYNIYIEQKQYNRARQLLTGVLEEGTLGSDINNRKTIYLQLAQTNAQLGDMDDAYSWAMKLYKLSDSLNQSRMREKMEELETRYQSVEKQKEINLLQAEKKQAALSASNSRLFNWMLASASLLLLVIAVILRFFYKNQKQLNVQKELNHQQTIREMEQQKHLATVEAMLHGEERERMRVARDLHDGLGGILAGVKIKLSDQLQQHPSTGTAEMEKIVAQLDGSVTELRRIAHNMMPETLMRFGLQSALKDLCESLQTPHTAIHFEAYSIDEQLDRSTQVAIYRMVQEALSNAIRHADAQTITVQCSQNGPVFFITVEDDGKGFDLNNPTLRKGMGMANIENRVQYLNGKLETSSEPGEGTTINIELHVAAQS